MQRGGYRGIGDAAAEPVAVLQAAIQQLVQRDQAAPDSSAAPAQPRRQVPAFIPADYFQGAKQGYYFGTGDEGTG